MTRPRVGGSSHRLASAAANSAVSGRFEVSSLRELGRGPELARPTPARPSCGPWGHETGQVVDDSYVAIAFIPKTWRTIRAAEVRPRGGTRRPGVAGVPGPGTVLGEPDVLEGGGVQEEVRVGPLNQIPDVGSPEGPPFGGGQLAQLVVADPHHPGRGPHEAGHQSHHRRLAHPRRTEQRHHLTAGDVKVDPAEGHDVDAPLVVEVDHPFQTDGQTSGWSRGRGRHGGGRHDRPTRSRSTGADRTTHRAPTATVKPRAAVRITRVTTSDPTGRPSSRGGPGPKSDELRKRREGDCGGGEARHRAQDDADSHGQGLLDLDGPPTSDA